ncbi:MAG: metallophosphoesterase family protein [Thermoplasmatota archaeon]
MDWAACTLDDVKTLDYDGAAACVHGARAAMQREPALLEPSGSLVLAGDVHGDFYTARAVVRRFLDTGYDHLVFLGDYVDRAPADVGSSVPAMTYLLGVKRDMPHRVHLLKGNHESHHLLPVASSTFDREAEARYPGLYGAYVQAFRMMPLMLLASNVFAAHGGILKGHDAATLRSIGKNDPAAVESLTWSDPVDAKTLRGAGDPYTGEELRAFLDDVDARLFVKGHDYSTLGTAIYHGRCLTVFTSRRYRDRGNGGVLIAEIDGPVDDIGDVTVKNYVDGNWRDYEVAVA